MEWICVWALALAAYFGFLWWQAGRDVERAIARAEVHLSEAHAETNRLKAANRALADGVAVMLRHRPAIEALRREAQESFEVR